jgi:glycerol kinase
MTANNLLMQFQADMLDTPVSRPVIPETTALGAAYAAGLAVGVWKDFAELKKQWALDRKFESKMEGAVRQKYWTEWQRAVEKSKGWVVEEGEEGKGKGVGGGVGAGGLGVGFTLMTGLALGGVLGWVAASRKK